jgi:hypothetical protein
MALLPLARYQLPGDKAPDTYAEFLFRTARPTLHELPARCR